MRRFVLTALLAFGPFLGAMAPARADVVTVLIGLSLPPYVIPADNRGMEYDVVKEALALRGHTMAPHYMPFARVPTELERGAGDAAMTINESSGLKLCYSERHIAYRNYAITLASRALRIDSIADLRNKTIRAFQNATAYLGPDFNAVATNNPGYAEAANQQTQDAMLFAGRVDVVVGDINIFNYYKASVASMVDVSQPVALHAIFPPVEYSVGFRDPKLCADFNEGLAELRRSGRYDAILKAYQ